MCSTEFTEIYRCAMIFALRFISFLFFNLLFCYVKDDLWIYTDFFGLSTEWTHEPYVPTIRGVVV